MADYEYYSIYYQKQALIYLSVLHTTHFFFAFSFYESSKYTQNRNIHKFTTSIYEALTKQTST